MASSFRKIHWTDHSQIKMRQYGLSKAKLISILHKPERAEEGIVPGTTAVMRTNKVFTNSSFKKNLELPAKQKAGQWKPKKSPGEIWLMYRDTKDLRRIISAWRYPGQTKPGQEIPVPKDIRAYIENLKEN